MCFYRWFPKITDLIRTPDFIMSLNNKRTSTWILVLYCICANALFKHVKHPCWRFQCNWRSNCFFSDFIYFNTIYMRDSKALTNLRISTDSPESSLLADAMITKLSRACLNIILTCRFMTVSNISYNIINIASTCIYISLSASILASSHTVNKRFRKSNYTGEIIRLLSWLLCTFILFREVEITH